MNAQPTANEPDAEQGEALWFFGGSGHSRGLRVVPLASGAVS
jgi:hypothetical protein